MPAKFLLKRSNVAGKEPAAADVDVGELAVNFKDQKLFTKEPGGTIVEVGGSGVWTVSGNDISYTAGAVNTGILRVNNTSNSTIQAEFGDTSAEYFRLAIDGNLVTPRAVNGGFRFTSDGGYRFDTENVDYAVDLTADGELSLGAYTGSDDQILTVDTNGEVSTVDQSTLSGTGPVGPEGPAGPQGPQGPAGVSISVHPPVADEAARIAITTDPDDAGTSVVQLDTGEFWTWDGTTWVEAGRIEGPAGPAGHSIKVTRSATEPTTAEAGDIWIKT